MYIYNDKCESLVFNAESRVKFPDGSDMKRVDNATYLGGIIANAKGNAAQIDIRNRIQQACTTAKALYPFFKKATCSIEWKIQVYHATIKAQLMYGLETSALSSVQLQQLDTFQQRGLRAILNIEPAWISRVSNEKVLQLATEAMGKEIKLFSIELRAKKVLLLGHILRTTQYETLEPMRMATFSNLDDDLFGNSVQLRNDKRRTGRPRAAWTNTAMKDAWQLNHQHEEFSPANPLHIQILHEDAVDRKF